MLRMRKKTITSKKRTPSIPLTPEEESNILKLLKEKKNAAEVCRITGKNEGPVRRIAKKNNIQFKRPCKPLKPQEEATILKFLVQGGKSACEIAKIVKRNEATVYRIAERNGYKLRWVKTPSKKVCSADHFDKKII